MWTVSFCPSSPNKCPRGGLLADRGEFRNTINRSVEDTYKRTLDHFPNPAIHFPSPTLEFDFRIAVKLKPESTQVHGRCHKEITAISSGCWSGSFGNGKIMVGSVPSWSILVCV